VVFATLRWPSRKLAHLHLSWLDPSRVRRLTIVGHKKMLVYDDTSDRPLALFDRGSRDVPRLGERMDYDQAPPLSPRGGSVSFPDVPTAEPLAMELAHLLECIERRESPLTDARNARKVVQVLEAGQRSLERGGGFEPLSGGLAGGAPAP
jgi:predicted dehydrogenase